MAQSQLTAYYSQVRNCIVVGFHEEGLQISMTAETAVRLYGLIGAALMERGEALDKTRTAAHIGGHDGSGH